jgi:hypothetical protein
MKDILEKLKKLKGDEFSSYLKNVLLNHEPFDELIEIKKIYPIEFEKMTIEIAKDSINSTKSLINELKGV